MIYVQHMIVFEITFNTCMLLLYQVVPYMFIKDDEKLLRDGVYSCGFGTLSGYSVLQRNHLSRDLLGLHMILNQSPVLG